MSIRNRKGVRFPICAGCGQPWAETPCLCGEGSLEPLLAYPATVRHIQETFARLKGNAVTWSDDFVGEADIDDLYPRTNYCVGDSP